MKIVLLGYMGCGKSAVGKQLAAALKYSFIDLDQAIEADEKMLLTQLFETKGEIYFRTKEHALLTSLLEKKQDTVLALGGGTPCYSGIMQQLIDTPDVISIYLSATLETLTTRLFLEKETRPLISHISEKDMLNDFLRKHLFERSFYYNQAKHKIAVDEKSLEEIVAALVTSLF
ncbi:MAG: shikimate kinase [Patiriisocius sp.]|jgi:shikimate kinase